MRTLQHASKTFADDLAAFCRSAAVPKEISDSVAAILADVRTRGDEAVAYYAAKFDGAKLRARDFRVPVADIAAAARRLPAAEARALAAARDNIVDFNQRKINSGNAPGHREPRSTDAGAEIDDALAWPRRGRRREQHGIVADTMARLRLAQAQLSSEKCVLGEIGARFSHGPFSSARNS